MDTGGARTVWGRNKFTLVYAVVMSTIGGGYAILHLLGFLR